MNIRCTSCNAAFRIKADSVPAQGARTKCPQCGEPILIQTTAKEEHSPAVPVQENLFALPPATLAPSPGDEDLFHLSMEETTHGVSGLHLPPAESSMAEPPGLTKSAPSSPSAAAPPRGGIKGWFSRLLGKDG